jgi:hypothetical protein
MGTASPPSPGRACCGDARRRGMRAPLLAVGDGALGLWAALRKVVKLLDCLPRWAPVRGPQGARADPRRRRLRACREGGQVLRRRLRRQVPKGRCQDHRRPEGTAGLLRFPGRALGAPEDVQPESTFATVRLRTRVTKAWAAGPPGWRWCSSSSRRPANAGATSTARTWSLWSGPGPRSRGSARRAAG